MSPTVAVFLGLLVALSYGAGDFLGGLSARQIAPLVVVQRSQLVGLGLLVVLVAVVPGQDPIAADLARGAAAGAIGAVGVGLLYRGLAVGAMAIVAPITAVGAAVLPVAWGLSSGERPGGLALTGVGLALVAVALISSAADPGVAGGSSRGREVGLALVAGAAFGGVFVCLGNTSADSGMWPVFAARVASVGLASLVLLARRQRAVVPPGSRLVVAATGALDVTANAMFLLAARSGLLSLAAVVSSLYPAGTVVLARVVLHERITTRQQGGLALALTGVVLIAL
jgi:drug/metabolite transporter (DMT)-like permease